MTYQVRLFIDEEQFKKDIGFSLADLSGAMMSQASLFAHYGVLAARAAKQVDDCKLLLENAEAKVYRLLRDKYTAAGTKVTEAMLEKEVSVHPTVVQFKKALNEARQVEAITKVYVEAFRNRKDMLIQEGAQQRKEMDGEVYVSRRNVADEINRDQFKKNLAAFHQRQKEEVE